MWLQLGLCKPVPEPTRPTGVDLPTPPLQPTNGAMSMSRTRREFRLRCGAVIEAANPEPKPRRTDPCFKCLELWIQRCFTEILSLKIYIYIQTHQWSPPCCMPPFFFFFLFFVLHWFFVLVCTSLVFYYFCNF